MQKIIEYKPFIIKFGKVSLWLLSLYASCLIRVETIYFILSVFYFMFTNLGKKKQGQLSAYSVFNKDCKQLPGTFSAEQMFKGAIGKTPQFLEEQKSKSYEMMDEEETEKAQKIDEFFKNQSKHGNKECFCGSKVKFKKCCLRKKIQEESERKKQKRS